MINAGLESGGEVPLWVDVLLVAQAWGIPPWELLEQIDGDRLEWFFRWQFWTSRYNAKVYRDRRDIFESAKSGKLSNIG